MKGVPFIFRIRKSLSTKITVMNAGIILLIFISLILTTVSINYQLTLENEKQKMNVYISNTLSSIDNKLKDMGRVSLMTYSDERTQEILKNYDSFAYAEQLDNVEYLRKLYTSLITIREDINSVYIFDLDSLVHAEKYGYVRISETDGRMGEQGKKRVWLPSGGRGAAGFHALQYKKLGR